MKYKKILSYLLVSSYAVILTFTFIDLFFIMKGKMNIILPVFEAIILAALTVAVHYYINKVYIYGVEGEKAKKTVEAELEDIKIQKDRIKQAQSTQFQLVNSIIKRMEIKDIYDEGHSERVASLAVGTAKLMGYTDAQLRIIEYAALLHDIGKIGIPTEILNKRETLSEGEYARVKRHSYIGYSMLKDFDFLYEVSDIILHHHERMDGKGYPDGLVKNEISEASRLLAVCESFDAMTSNRDLSKRMNIEDAFRELEKNSGTQFDERIVSKLKEYIINNGNEHMEEEAENR